MQARELKRKTLVLARRGIRRDKRTIYKFFGSNEDGYSAVLNRASLISLVLLLSAMLCDRFGLLPVRIVISLIFVTIILGLYVFISFMEKVFAKSFIDFKSTQLLWVGFIAFLTYIAHGQAGDEINSIFSQDASTFPYATTAATAMVLGSWTLWPAFLIGMLSLLYAASRLFRPQRRQLLLIAVTVGIQLSIFSMFVEYQMARETVRKNNIYQIALAMDFNGNFRCDDAKVGRDSVVFIGDSQDSALVAPPLIIKHENKESIFKEVEVPAAFRRVSCM